MVHFKVGFCNGFFLGGGLMVLEKEIGGGGLFCFVVGVLGSGRGFVDQSEE